MEFISQIATKVHQFSFTSHVLTQIQVYESQKEGLIPSNIDVLLDRIIMSYPSSDSTFGSGGNLSPRFLESIGIKESFFTQRAKGIGNAICCDSIHITDFYLIHCTGYLGKNFAPPKLTFIPLEYVEYCALVFGLNFNGYIKPTYTTVEKNPVKGAIIGGIVGGTTGAVIGAAANSGTKTVLNTPGGSYNDDSYSLSIKIQGQAPQTEMRFYECRNTEENSEIVNQKNQNVRMLIERAKALDINEKKNIVKEENKRKWKEAGRCQYCGGVIKGLFKRKCVNCGQERDY